MTTGRKAALQWFHDRGEVNVFDTNSPSAAMRKRMMQDGQLVRREVSPWSVRYSLTDKGRRDLHDAGK